MAEVEKETVEGQDIVPQQKVDTNTAKKDSTVRTEEDICRELVTKEYAKNYPKNKEWHVTTDHSVFLAEDLRYAMAHQKTLKGGGEVVTITTK